MYHLSLAYDELVLVMLNQWQPMMSLIAVHATLDEQQQASCLLVCLVLYMHNNLEAAGFKSSNLFLIQISSK